MTHQLAILFYSIAYLARLFFKMINKLTNDCKVGDFYIKEKIVYLIVCKDTRLSKQTKKTDNVCDVIGYTFGLKEVNTKMCEIYLK